MYAGQRVGKWRPEMLVDFVKAAQCSSDQYLLHCKASHHCTPPRGTGSAGLQSAARWRHIGC